jgi:hypothetical protein
MPAGTTPRLSLPITLDATNNTFQITEGGGGALNVTVVAGTYYWLGDGTAADLCLAIKAALEVAGALTYTVTESAGVLTISATGAWVLIFGAGVHLLSPALLGMTDADHASAGAGNSVVGTFQVDSGYWVEQAYTEDTESCPVHSVASAWSLSGRNVGLSYGSRTFRTIGVDLVPARKVFQAEEVRAQESFQRIFLRLASGVAFEFTPSVLVPATHSKYVIRDPRWCNSPLDSVFRLHETVVRRYQLTLPMQLYVAS